MRRVKVIDSYYIKGEIRLYQEYLESFLQQDIHIIY